MATSAGTVNSAADSDSPGRTTLSPCRRGAPSAHDHATVPSVEIVLSIRCMRTLPRATDTAASRTKADATTPLSARFDGSGATTHPTPTKPSASPSNPAGARRSSARKTREKPVATMGFRAMRIAAAPLVTSWPTNRAAL